MRLDYYCPVIVRTAKGKAVTNAAKLKKLGGYICDDEGADFTTFIDNDVDGADLIGAPLELEFIAKSNSLFARVGFYPAQPVSEAQRGQLTDYVIGQFLDGFGSHPLAIRKGLSRYHVTFVTDPHIDGADTVTPYPYESEHAAPDYAYIRGPFEINTPRPQPKPSRKIVSQAQKMQIAATNGDLSTVKILIENGCPVDVMVIPEESFLTAMTALGWAANRAHMDMLTYLIARGANPNAKTNRGDTILMMAETPEIVQLLLDAGADPNLKNESNMDAIAYYRDQASFFEDSDDDEPGPAISADAALGKTYHDKIATIETWLTAQI